MTVAGLLLATAILAFDVAAIELLRRERSWLFGDARLLIVVLPSVNALAMGLYLLRRQLMLRGEGSPFLVGFQAAGWPAVAAALIAELGFSYQVFLYQRWAEAGLADFWNTYIMWDGGFTRLHWDALNIGFDVVALAAPQFLVALLGGWVAAWLGVGVVRGPAPTGRPRAIPARRATAALVGMAVLLVAAVWAAKVRGRWLVYRAWVAAAISGEAHYRHEYERAVKQIRALDEKPGEMANDRARRAAFRQLLVERSEQSRRRIEENATLRQIYEPAARRPWLPIPPNPPLNTSELNKPR